MQLTLEALKQDFSVCKCKELSQIDYMGDFCFVGKTDAEISLVCETPAVPADLAAHDDGWKAFRIKGILEFSLIGILSKLSSLLADNEIGIFAVGI